MGICKITCVGICLEVHHNIAINGLFSDQQFTGDLSIHDPNIDFNFIGAINLKDSVARVPLLAAVGPLQFEVVQHRLKGEYGADTRLESAPWSAMRWVDPAVSGDVLDGALMPSGSRLAYDAKDHPVILFGDTWACDYFIQKNAEIKISRLPFDIPGGALL